MGLELAPDRRAERLEQHPHALAPRELECRDQVAVPGDDDQGVDQPAQCESCDVEPDAEVDALLLQVRFHVFRADRPAFSTESGERAWSKLPATERELAHAHRDVWRELQCVVELLGFGKSAGGSQIEDGIVDRIPDAAGRRRRVVPVDPQQPQAVQRRMAPQARRFGDDIGGSRRTPQAIPWSRQDETAVEENRVLRFHDRGGR